MEVADPDEQFTLELCAKRQTRFLWAEDVTGVVLLQFGSLMYTASDGRA